MLAFAGGGSARSLAGGDGPEPALICKPPIASARQGGEKRPGFERLAESSDATQDPCRCRLVGRPDRPVATGSRRLLGELNGSAATCTSSAGRSTQQHEPAARRFRCSASSKRKQRLPSAPCNHLSTTFPSASRVTRTHRPGVIVIDRPPPATSLRVPSPAGLRSSTHRPVGSYPPTETRRLPRYGAMTARFALSVHSLAVRNRRGYLGLPRISGRMSSIARAFIWRAAKPGTSGAATLSACISST